MRDHSISPAARNSASRVNAAKNIKLALVAVAAALAVTLAIASPARAATPTREDLGSIPYSITVDCSPYGFDFANIVQGIETLFVETFCIAPAPDRDSDLGTGLGDKCRAPQGHSGSLKEHIEEGRNA